MPQTVAVIDREVTWNNAGLAYKAIRIRVRNTNSASGSKLIDLEVDGVSMFSVGKDGALATAAGFSATTIAGTDITATSVTATAMVRSASAVAPPAAGAVTCGITASSTANLGLFFGTGAPTFSAAKGSLYSRTDATTTTTRLYINTDGGTTWTTFTTAA